MDKDAFWFKHDSNAKDDPKILILIEELGLEGYGIFWVLIETLRDQKEFKAPLRILPAIARRYNTTTEKVKAVVTRYDLFQIHDEEFFFSRSLIERMEPLLDKKHSRKIGGIKGNLIKYGYAKKEDLDSMTDEQIVRLNEEKQGFSLTDRLPIADRSLKEERRVEERRVEESRKEKKRVETNISVTSLEDDVPSASDPETWQSAIRVSEYLLEAICETDPTHRYASNKPSLKGWAKQIDLGLRRDGRTEEQFKFIIDAIFRECHKFSDLWHKWHLNIESGKKLRDQFDKIKNQIRTSQNGTSRKQTKGDRDAEILRNL